MTRAPAALKREQMSIRRWVRGDSSSRQPASLIVDQTPLSAGERVKVYAKGWRARLGESLGGDLKVSRKLLGSRKFDQLVLSYVKKYPSRSPSLFDLSARLPRFLVEKKYPVWFQDLVRLEMAVDRAITATDPKPIPVEHLTDSSMSSAARLRLRLAVPVTLLESRYPLDQMWSKAKKYSSSALRRFVVYRTEFRVYVAEVDRQEYSALKSLEKGLGLNAFLQRSRMPEKRIEWLGSWAARGIVEISAPSLSKSKAR